MEAVQIPLPTLATAELEAAYGEHLAREREDAIKARTENIARRNAVRMEADRAARMAANEARRLIYLGHGYRECTQAGCQTLTSPGYDLCIPHTQAKTA